MDASQHSPRPPEWPPAISPSSETRRIKLTLDANFKNEIARVGIIARDSSGVVLGLLTRFDTALSPCEAELWACEVALSWAIRED